MGYTRLENHHTRNNRQWLSLLMLILLTSINTISCSTQPSARVSPDAVWYINSSKYNTARDQLRRYSIDRQSPEIILDNLRLAVAAIHDGAFFEAEQALLRAYPYMVTGTVNSKNRQDAATFSYEGLKVWKGEPFEQAMAWYYQTILQMISGDWENARAMSRNLLFTLVDFAKADTVDQAMQKAESPEWFDENAQQVESDLVMGYLLSGIAEYWQDQPVDADANFDYALTLAPHLKTLIEQLRIGNYNTLILIEAEPGPRKIPQGNYNEYFTYLPKPSKIPEALLVTDKNGNSIIPDNSTKNRLDIVDTWTLAQHPRWWSLRSLRETKRVLGDVLTMAGTGAVVYGTNSNDDNSKDKALIGGILAILAGQALATSSQADLRYFDALPRTVYMVPLNLNPERHALRFSLPDLELDVVRHDIMPGQNTPAVYVVRLEPNPNIDKSQNDIYAKLNQPVIHPNDHTGPIPGTYPYILGGTCVCTPSYEVLENYQASGYLRNYTLENLLDLYRYEGIIFEPRPLASDTVDTYRHILDGGKLLYTPIPGSAGYERLTYQPAKPYEPKSDQLKQLIVQSDY